MERRFPRPFKPLLPLGLDRVWRLIDRYPRIIRILSICLIAAGAVAALGTRFDGNLKNLQPRHSEAFLTQEKIERHLSLAPKQLLIAIDGQEADEVLERTQRVDALAQGYQSAGRISGWSSLGRVINSPGQQAEILGHISGVQQGERVTAFEDALLRHGFNLSAFEPFTRALAGFDEAEALPVGEAVARLTASPLRGVVQRHLMHDPSGYHSLLYVYYGAGQFNQDMFLKDLAAIEPAARATGIDLVSSQLAASVKHSFLLSFSIGSALVLLVLLVHFRTSGVLALLFPVLSGVAAMLGTMAIFGMRLNFMNAMVLVTIVGMGSDYGLHIGHRAGEAGGNVPDAYIQAGRAVLMSAVTTIAGFGSLAFADYPALASIGWATNLGVGYTALFALISLPALAISGNSITKGRLRR